MNNIEDKQVFRVEGFTCANCAGKFEKNVKQLPGVEDAKVNFGASKITIVGHASIEQLEKAGAFEKLKVYPEKDVQQPFNEKEKTNVFKKYNMLLFSFLFIVLGYVSFFINGEKDILTIVLFLSAIIIGGYSLFIVGFQNLIHLDFDMRTLMTIAIIGAVLIGEWAEGAIVVVLFALSEALERYSMDQARKSIKSLMDIAPNEAIIRRNDEEIAVPVEKVKIGEIMVVKPGQKIAMDGVVVRGASTVNEAAITGESIPIEKKIGDEVFAGTLNEEGHLEVEITKYVKDNTLSKIIELVEEAQAERAPAQAFVDKFAKYYTPIIMLIALFVGTMPPLILNGSWSEWIYQGLALLVVGCPCALVISTPISIVSAISSLAKNGVLVKGGIYLEEIGTLKAIAFDKTGTLTKGTPIVSYMEIGNKQKEKEILSITVALEKLSNHPLGNAIVKKAKEMGINGQDVIVENFQSIPGKGVYGEVNGTPYYVGSPNLLKEIVLIDESTTELISNIQSEGKSVILVGTKETILGIFAIHDEIRESSEEVIRKLHDLNIEKTIMLTGDNKNAAQFIGNEIGVSDVQAQLMPEDKLKRIHQLKKQYNKVAMVGDGVNDAPALVAATVGIAMGKTGTDTALETADVVLMSDELNKLPLAVQLSRKTLKIIKANIIFALSVKLLALLLVVPGWLTLWIAIFSDIGATLIVSLNSMRLLKMKVE